MIQSLQRIFKAKKSNNIEFPSIQSIFRSIAMFSCHFAKVAILDHYSWSEGSGDEIAEYFKV